MKAIMIIISLILVLYLLPIGIYVDSKINGVKVSFLQFLRLRFKKFPTRLVLDWTKKLNNFNYNLTFTQIAELYNKGYDIDNISSGLIKAREEKVFLTFEKACEADLNNIDISKTIKKAVSNVEIKK